MQADYGGDAERAGDDGRMTRAAAHIGGEAQNHVGIELRRFGGRQVVGEQYDRLGELIEAVTLFAQQRPQQPFGEVVNVRAALAQVDVGDTRQAIAQVASHLSHGPLGVLQAFTHAALDLADKHGILEQQDLGVEDLRHAGSQRLVGTRP